jgi:muramoyltetrapeptide carboxypeptidase
MDPARDVKLLERPHLLRAPSLEKGGRIRLCVPSSPADPAKLRRAARTLRQAGYRVGSARNAAAVYGYLAGSDAERAAALNEALADPEVEALLAARGGYGAMRLLDRLDFEPLRDRPKLLVGYSDFSAVLLAAYRRTGLVGFHGPLAAVELAGPHAGYALRRLQRALRPKPLGALPTAAAVPLRPGRGRGPLLGGCLSLLAHLAGTGFLPRLDGAVLFWEEVGEPPYRIDRMLTQLRLSGHLDGLAALLVGGLTDCVPPEGRPSLTVQQVVLEVTAGTRYPILFGLPFGHVLRPWTLPLGVRTRVEADEQRGRIVVEEAATLGRTRTSPPAL